MRFDANSIKCDIDDINEKIDYLKYVIETKQDELDKIKKQIRDIHKEIATGLMDTMDRKIKSFVGNYQTQLIDNIQKIIV